MAGPIIEPDIAGHLEALGQAELDDVGTFLATLSNWECGALLVEAARCLDHTQVMQFLSSPQGGYLPGPDFDIIGRGWNVVLGLLLPRVGKFTGVPATESTPHTQRVAMSVMHAAGRHVILTDTAERVRHGLVAARLDADGITLGIAEATLIDFFHDQVDRGRLTELRARFFPEDGPADREAALTLRAEMAAQTFRWELPIGVMVGYGSTPNIDSYFAKLQWSKVLEWRDEAGIHPDAALPGCTGADLIATVTVMLSFYLKHIIFVEEARKRFADVNHHMSLTIWKTRDELVASLVAAGSPHDIAETVVDFITVRAEDAPFFLAERTPFVPLLIEIVEGYLLTPASAVFQNPFSNIRSLRDATTPGVGHAVRVHRENWMADDLYALFQGTRYQRVQGQTKLRSKGRTVTDIDAAIFDWVSGELVLFQLKWQDFASANIRTQKSKAKNFVHGVESWADKVTGWINEHGVSTLCQSLQIKLPAGAAPSAIRLWGVGRSNARFGSLGYPSGTKVLALTWPQLIRLRHEVGSGADIFAEVAARALDESSRPARRVPLAYVMLCRGTRVLFKDIWSTIPAEATAEATVD